METFAEIGKNVQCSYKKFYFILKIADVKSAFADTKMIDFTTFTSAKKCRREKF